MQLCVGAVSRRVIEEAAKAKVAQIVASRRQVDIMKGYTGLNQTQFVDLVIELSEGYTQVVRDHGGPNQGWQLDDGIKSFDEDLTAGFDVLHLDVCKLPRDEQEKQLMCYANRYKKSKIGFEVGGEHDDWAWTRNLYHLLTDTGFQVDWVVMDTGSFIWAERQRGKLKTAQQMLLQKADLDINVRTKAHNFDWVARRELNSTYVDAYNLAPELAAVEADAMLTCMPRLQAYEFLNTAYKSQCWNRWFNEGEGTHFERARCAARYVLEFHSIKKLDVDEDYVRERIRDAISRR